MARVEARRLSSNSSPLSLLEWYCSIVVALVDSALRVMALVDSASRLLALADSAIELQCQVQ